jgi:hypothetical protein
MTSSQEFIRIDQSKSRNNLLRSWLYKDWLWSWLYKDWFRSQLSFPGWRDLMCISILHGIPRLRLIDSDEFLRRSHETTGNISFLVQSPHYIELQNVVSLDMRACPIQNKIIGPFKIDSTRFNCIYFKA